KQLVMERLFAGERTALAQRLQPLLGGQFDLEQVTRALTELTASMPVYRTYPRSADISPPDRAALDTAFSELARRVPDLPPDLVAGLRNVVLLEHEQPEAALEFVLRW